MPTSSWPAADLPEHRRPPDWLPRGQVIVLDQRSFPRDKDCNDFVGPAAIVELEALGVTARPDYAASNIIRQAALFLCGRELIRRRLPEVEGLPSYGRASPRKQLDHWLLEAASGAGAQIMRHGGSAAKGAAGRHDEAAWQPFPRPLGIQAIQVATRLRVTQCSQQRPHRQILVLGKAPLDEREAPSVLLAGRPPGSSRWLGGARPTSIERSARRASTCVVRSNPSYTPGAAFAGTLT
jgi:hypothetical protein